MRNRLVLAVLTIAAATSATAQLTTASIDLNNQVPALRLALVPAAPQERPRAVAHSDLYYTRLKIHRIGSYVMLPVFAAQYYVGDRLLKDDPPSWARGTHSALAGGIAGLFAVNTITGVWNAWESRHDSNGRARKYLHAALLLAADVGFLWTAQTAEGDDDGGGGGSNANIHHRNVALGSIGAATVGTVMMWLWK